MRRSRVSNLPWDTMKSGRLAKPQALEADSCTVVSRAFQILSDPDKKTKYDRFGGDPDNRFGPGAAPPSSPFSGFARSPSGGRGPMFDDEISPEELFNRFFGGGMGGGPFGEPWPLVRVRSCKPVLILYQEICSAAEAPSLYSTWEEAQVFGFISLEEIDRDGDLVKLPMNLMTANSPLHLSSQTSSLC